MLEKSIHDRLVTMSASKLIGPLPEMPRCSLVPRLIVLLVALIVSLVALVVSLVALIVALVALVVALVAPTVLLVKHGLCLVHGIPLNPFAVKRVFGSGLNLAVNEGTSEASHYLLSFVVGSWLTCDIDCQPLLKLLEAFLVCKIRISMIWDVDLVAWTSLGECPYRWPRSAPRTCRRHSRQLHLQRAHGRAWACCPPAGTAAWTVPDRNLR